MASRLLAMILLCLALLEGCSSYNPRTIPDTDIAERRLPSLQEELLAAPDDAELNYQVGVALFSLHRLPEAASHLGRALDGDPSMTEAAVVLAKIQEDEGQFAAAEATLLRVDARNAGEKELVEGARERVGRARSRERTRRLMAEERELDTGSIPENTLAVHQFEADPSAWEIKNLGKALAHVLVTDLSQLKDLRLVERSRLQTLADEINLAGSKGSQSRGVVKNRTAPSGLAPVDQLMGVQQRLALLDGEGGAPLYAGDATGELNDATKEAIRAFQASAGLQTDGVPGPRTQSALEEATAGLLTGSGSERRSPAPGFTGDAGVRAGRLLGARRLITGDYGSVDEGYIQVRARLFDTVDGSVGAALESEQELAEFHRISGDLVVKTADALQIELTDDERRRILSLPPPTKSLAAFLAFGEGLDLEDRGLIDDARAAYAEAVRLDPDFQIARQRVKRTEIGAATIYQVIGRIHRSGGSAGTAGKSGSKEAMARAIGAVGLGVEEDATRTDDAATRDPQADGPPTGVVHVSGQIPVGN